MNRREAIRIFAIGLSSAVSGCASRKPTRNRLPNLSLGNSLNLGPFRPAQTSERLPTVVAKHGTDNSVRIYFHSFQADLINSGESQMATERLAGDFRAVFDFPASFRGYLNTLRFLVRKDLDARVLLTVDLSGTCKVFDYPFDQSTSGRTQVERFASLLDWNPLSIPEPSLPRYSLAIELLVERRNLFSRPLVIVDSLSVQGLT